METRLELLEAVKKSANLKDLRQADAVSRTVVALTKLIIGDDLSQRIAEKMLPEFRRGWELVDMKYLIMMKRGGLSLNTRKEFLEAVMRLAYLKDMKQADAIARAVISLTKLVIGDEFSQQIAQVSPPDLREGWESIRAARADGFEAHELLFETGEASEG
jgi:hypothetical protein